MDRRRFLSTLIGAGLTAAIDPERLLWIPGKKTVFIPPPIRGQHFDVVTYDDPRIMAGKYIYTCQYLSPPIPDLLYGDGKVESGWAYSLFSYSAINDSDGATVSPAAYPSAHAIM